MLSLLMRFVNAFLIFFIFRRHEFNSHISRFVQEIFESLLDLAQVVVRKQIVEAEVFAQFSNQVFIRFHIVIFFLY